MRNPERIKKILPLLEKAWLLVPHFRLGQLISNLQGTGVQDVFSAEDDVWEERIIRFLEEHTALKEEINKIKL